MSHIERRRQIIEKVANTLLHADIKDINKEVFIQEICVETGCSRVKAMEYLDCGMLLSGQKRARIAAEGRIECNTCKARKDKKEFAPETLEGYYPVCSICYNHEEEAAAGIL